MKKIEHKAATRIVYVVIAILIIVAGYAGRKALSSQELINEFSFWCGIATLVALVVAVGEVLNSGTTQSLIRKAVEEYAEKHAQLIAGTSISEVISLLDEANAKASSQDYESSARAVQIARRFLARVDSRFFSLDTTANGLSDLFNKAELKIQTATHSTLKAPITPRQRKEISATVCEIKAKIEVMERTGVIK